MDDDLKNFRRDLHDLARVSRISGQILAPKPEASSALRKESSTVGAGRYSGEILLCCFPVRLPTGKPEGSFELHLRQVQAFLLS